MVALYCSETVLVAKLYEASVGSLCIVCIVDLLYRKMPVTCTAVKSAVLDLLFIWTLCHLL